MPSTFEKLRTILAALRNGQFTLMLCPICCIDPGHGGCLCGGFTSRRCRPGSAIVSDGGLFVWAGAATLTIANYRQALELLSEENRRLESITHQQQAKLLEMAREAAMLAERVTEFGTTRQRDPRPCASCGSRRLRRGPGQLSSATAHSHLETAMERSIDTSRIGSFQTADRLPASGVGGGELYPYDLSAQLHGSLTALRSAVESQSDRLAALKTSAEAYQHKMRHTPNAWPVTGRVTSEYGRRRHPTRGVYQHHAGIDIAVPLGTPVLATAAGKVVHAGPNGGYGLTVVIDHGDGLRTLYAHNTRVLVSQGIESNGAMSSPLRAALV